MHLQASRGRMAYVLSGGFHSIPGRDVLCLSKEITIGIDFFFLGNLGLVNVDRCNKSR